MVCCIYFNSQKELGVDVLDFQFELGYFGYSLGYISKYWGKFLFNFMVTLNKGNIIGVWYIVGLPNG
jgi:hypothetical protein